MINLKSIRAAFRETWQKANSLVTLYVIGALTVIATVAGPFETFNLNWPARASYWAVVITASVVLGFAARALALGLVGPNRPVLFDSLATVSLSVVLGPLIWVFTNEVMASLGSPMLPLVHMMGYVFLVASIVFVFRRLLPGFEARGYAFQEPAPTAEERPVVASLSHTPKPRLARRLAEGDGAEILRLTGRGHHVEIVTATSVHTVRMRLADAIDEMEAVKGLSVHRSHWVTVNAVANVERESGQKMFVLLNNGDRIPIGRKYQTDVEDAGLLH